MDAHCRRMRSDKKGFGVVCVLVGLFVGSKGGGVWVCAMCYSDFFMKGGREREKKKYSVNQEEVALIRSVGSLKVAILILNSTKLLLTLYY